MIHRARLPSYIFIVMTTLISSTMANNYEESPLQNVTAVMEGQVLLPCDITTKIEDDQANMIMFYRNNSGTPIYTVDLRNHRRSKAKHKPSNSLINRAQFELKSGKSGLLLRNVWSSDDGLYRCRIDFKMSPTRNSRIYLSVIVPPDSVRIVDQTGAEQSSTIGPYVLGQPLVLTCVATGGRPPPKLSWWTDHQPVKGITRISGNEVGNTLEIPSLQRRHLQQSFICHASNENIDIPVTAAVTVDMKLPPLSVSIRGIRGPISAGVGVTVTCEVIGARPTPTITWLLDGKRLRSLGERNRDSENVTESTLKLQVSKEDQNRRLTCQADTPGLLQSRMEKHHRLQVYYLPSVRITINPRVNVEDIRESDDVYLTCSIDAIPPPSSVNWFHNDLLLHPNSTLGVVVSNVSLVLQKASRYSSGHYVCKARNTEGQGTSRPVTIKVKYAPVCSSKQKLVYGVAKNERSKIICHVNAHPPQVSFSWHFNNSQDLKKISDTHITNNWTMSTLSYTPSNEKDYGLLMCTASNSVGRQAEPCVYKIFPAGPPDTLKNCSVINESLDSVEVHCSEGFDGGLPQSFIMEVFENRERKLKSNVTSKSASFTVRGLPSGLPLTIRLYAANTKGRSPVSVLQASTLADRAEKHTSGVVQASELPSTMELYPSLTIILGVIGGILIVFIVIVTVMVVKKPRRTPNRPSLQQDDSSLHILKKEDSQSGRLDGDEKDPDVIPEVRGNRGDGCGRTVSDVSTIYGELVTQSPQSNNTNGHAHLQHQQQVDQNQDVLQQHHHSNHASNSNQPSLKESSSISHFTPPPSEFQNAPPVMPIAQQHSAPLHRPQAHMHHQQMVHPHLMQHRQSPQQNPNQGRPQQQYYQTSQQPQPHSLVIAYSHPQSHPSAIPPSYTQTLPHPRHGRNQFTNAGPQSAKGARPHIGTLVRRGSLYMDPCTQPLTAAPLAPPPPYNSLDSADLGAIVPMIGETVRITPNNAGGVSKGLMSPPDNYPPKPFPSSFSSEQDRMESSV